MVAKSRSLRRRSRRRNVPSWLAPVSIVGGVVVLGGIAYGVIQWALNKKGRKIREIPDSAIPPAYPPGVRASQSLGSPLDLGLVDLSKLFDPKIIVLRPQGSAVLDATRWKKTDERLVQVLGAWTYPTADEPYLDEGEPFFDSWHGLFNIGGPSAHKIYAITRGDPINEHVNLVLVTAENWGPDDWAQLRLYRADVTLSDYKPVDNSELQFVDSVRIRTDLQPVQTVWIMGAYT